MFFHCSFTITEPKMGSKLFFEVLESWVDYLIFVLNSAKKEKSIFADLFIAKVNGEV